MDPRRLNGCKVPQIRLADVRQIAEIGCAPPEGRQRIKRRPTNGHKVQRHHHDVIRHFAVGSTVRSVAEGGERVSSVWRIQVVPGRDGVLSRIGRIAGLAAGQRIRLVMVVTHQTNHRVQILDFGFISSKNQRPGGTVVREPVSVLVHQRRLAG